ncbi:hypothetical protein [uncultured Christiangramia sp.]|nr:hypothetical protein [uncultured Christiangramia sp.]
MRNDWANWAYPLDENRNGQLMKDFISMLGGLIVLAGLYISFIRSRAMDRNVQNNSEQLKIQGENLKIQTSQIEISRESIVNDQFKNAVEHLGDDKEPIILGGIAELNLLASNYPDKFASIVVNIYCNYIKSEAPEKKSDDDIKKNVIRSIIENLSKNKVFHPFEKNLQFTNLGCVDLSNFELNNFDLSYSILPYSLIDGKINNCEINRSKKSVVRMEHIKFSNCNMHLLFENGTISNCTFDQDCFVHFLILDTDFENVDFNNDIGRSEFYNCLFTNCNFMNSQYGFRYYCCSFEFTSFKGEFLSETFFFCSYFKNVEIESYLKGNDFTGGKLNHGYHGVYPFSIKVKESLINETDLSGINFSSNLVGQKTHETEYMMSEKIANHVVDMYNTRVDDFSQFKKTKHIEIPINWEKVDPH